MYTASTFNVFNFTVFMFLCFLCCIAVKVVQEMAGAWFQWFTDKKSLLAGTGIGRQAGK